MVRVEHGVWLVRYFDGRRWQAFGEMRRPDLEAAAQHTPKNAPDGGSWRRRFLLTVAADMDDGRTVKEHYTLDSLRGLWVELGRCSA